jgi:hypothetical protein
MSEASGGPVGPIVFSDATARKQLVDEGRVVTFRKRDRTTGATWWRKSRTGEKEGDVVVKQIAKIDPADSMLLAFHREESGFETTKAWMDAIRELNGGELPESGYLYEVSKNHD